VHDLVSYQWVAAAYPILADPGLDYGPVFPFACRDLFPVVGPPCCGCGSAGEPGSADLMLADVGVNGRDPSNDDPYGNGFSEPLGAGMRGAFVSRA